jgi:hypothetical protein
VAGSTCLCRPLYQVPAGSTDVAQSSGTPSVTASNSPTPGRVQKNSRRQSGLQAAPENIAKALDSTPELGTPQIINGTPTSKVLPYSDIVQQHSSATWSSTPGQSFPALLPKQTANENENVKPSNGGCCSQKSQPAPPVQRQGSCCSRAQPTTKDENDDLTTGSSNYSRSWSQTSYLPSQIPPWTQSHQIGGYSRLNSGFGHPPMHGQAYTNGFITSPSVQMNYSLPTFDSNNLGNHVGIDQLLSSNSHGYPFVQPSMFGADRTHECNCGDDCQCLGCASHPFNNTTRQHVEEMGYMMSIGEEDDNSESSTPFALPISPRSYPSKTVADVASRNEVQSQPRQDFSENTSASTVDNLFPATASTDQAARQLMQPSEYYTLEYPVGLPSMCSNVTGTCQCGNDCSCVGCLTHSGHDGVTLEPAPDGGGPVPDGPLAHPYYEFSDYTTAPRTLDEFSPSALSPPIIEASLV